MIRALYLFAALLTSASAAVSQEVTVRSGEHDGYTRLVFQVPANTEWALAQQKNGARLTLNIEDVTYQTRGVFTRLQTNRLKALSQPGVGAPLEMEFGCDCVASAFLYRDTMIVVDIAAATALPPLALDIPEPVSRRPVEAIEEPGPALAAEDLTLPLLNLSGQGFKQQLSTRLLQGADRQVLDLNLAPVGPRSSSALERLEIPQGLNANIGISTVLDDLGIELAPGLAQIETRATCISTAQLGFSTWSTERSFPDQLATLRGGLFQEFDQIDADKVLKLAKLYAFHGFGVEAVRTLELLENPTEQADWVSAIADVVDHRISADRTPFDGMQRCEGDAALWAVLTEGTLASDVQLDKVEQSFARLPEHLRLSLGSDLSAILVDADELEAARRVLRSVDRIQPDNPPDVTQAKAKVAAAEGNESQAEALLTQVVESPDAALEAPIALARLVEKRWQDRGSITPQELELAASYAAELRRADIGMMMARTHAVARSLNHEFDTALKLTRDLTNDEDRAKSMNRVLQILAERSDDITFLKHVLGLSEGESGQLVIGTTIAVSDRLAKLGFATQALALSGRQQDTAQRSERARLRARAALLKGRPHQVLLEISDDDSDDAKILRIQAMDAIGDFAAAGVLSRALGDAQAADRYFWLADLPSEIDPDATGSYAELNDLTLALSQPATRVPEKPLADAVSLLADSIGTRQAIGALLDAVTRD